MWDCLPGNPPIPPSAIEPQPIALAGADDDNEPSSRTAQDVADALAVLGYAFAPAPPDLHAACPNANWLCWDPGARRSYRDCAWLGEGACYFETLEQADARCRERVEPYVVRERMDKEMGAFCNGATLADLDALTAWLSGASTVCPPRTPGRLLREAEMPRNPYAWLRWPSPYPSRSPPMTRGEWRRGLLALSRRTWDNPPPNDPPSVVAQRLVEEELRRRLASLPLAAADGARARL